MRKILIFLLLIVYVTNIYGLNFWIENYNQLTLNASSVVLMEVETGKVLYARNPFAVIPPASLAKVMTIHLAYKAIANGKFSYDSIIPISARADFDNQPLGSSLMFVAEGHIVTLYELMLGLALPSGNDAAIAVAEAVGGTVEEFVAMMNAEAEAIGLRFTTFTEPSGIDRYNLTTAYEFAYFTRRHLQQFPQAIYELYNVRNFTFPTRANWGEERRTQRAAWTRANTNNGLLNQFSYANGLKTGFITASGHNLVATAKRDGMQLIAVILGIHPPGIGFQHPTGARMRNEDAITLFNFGFDNYEVIDINHIPQTYNMQVTVLGGNTSTLNLRILNYGNNKMLIRKGSSNSIRVHKQIYSLIAPIQSGSEVGRLTISYNNEVQSFPLIATNTITVSYRFSIRVIAHIVNWFFGFIRSNNHYNIIET
jgi:D-alanyl-D-alanine carboxypeptidase (penicillin-binding protein 5/6)